MHSSLATSLLFLAGALILLAIATMLPGRTPRTAKKPSSSPDETRSSGLQKRECVLRSTWIDVTPAPFKVFSLREGKSSLRVMVYGPRQGVVRRTILLSRGDKQKTIFMERLFGVSDADIDEVYTSTISEAQRIAQSLHGKKKRAETPLAEKAPEVLEPSKPEVVTSASAPAEKPSSMMSINGVEPTIIKGFKSQVVGRLISAKPERHVSTRNGQHVEYESFTVTIETPDGLERVVGNDLGRAISAAKVEPGESIRVIHMKDVELSNGFKKKQYQITKV